jgi:hypothetical protein
MHPVLGLLTTDIDPSCLYAAVVATLIDHWWLDLQRQSIAFHKVALLRSLSFMTWHKDHRMVAMKPTSAVGAKPPPNLGQKMIG